MSRKRGSRKRRRLTLWTSSGTYEFLLSRKLVIILVADLAVLLALLITLRATRIYSASALVRVSQQDAAGNVASYDPSYAARLMDTSVQLITSRPILQGVIGDLNLQMSPDELFASVKAEALPNTELIRITANSPDRPLAAKIANAFATVFTKQGQQVFSGQGQSATDILQSQIAAAQARWDRDRTDLAGQGNNDPVLSAAVQSDQRTYAGLLDQLQKARVDQAIRANSLSVVAPATVPDAPSKPRVALNLVAGLVLGLLAGSGLALGLDYMNPGIHSADDLKGLTDIPLVGQVPRFQAPRTSRNRANVLALASPGSPAAEAFRRLATSTLFLASRDGARVMLVTSAEPTAGSSTVVANLAAAIAQAGRRVTIVDADLRKPAQHMVYGMARKPGLTEVLCDQVALATAIRPTEVPGVDLLTSGRSVVDPGPVLSLPALADVIRSLAGDSDVVLVDAPPVLAVADAQFVAPLADGVLLVAARDQTTAKTLGLAVKELGQVGSTVLGTIYNRSKSDGLDRYYSVYARPRRHRADEKTEARPEVGGAALAASSPTPMRRMQAGTPARPSGPAEADLPKPAGRE